MKRFKKMLLWIPINLYLEIAISESFKIDTLLFDSKHHIKILEHYKNIKYWYMSI